MVNPGEKIQKLRKERSIKQTEFAKIIGTTRSHLSEIESGKKNLSMKMALKISEALGVPLRELVENSLGSKEMVLINDSTGTAITITEKQHSSIKAFEDVIKKNPNLIWPKEENEQTGNEDDLYRMFTQLQYLGRKLESWVKEYRIYYTSPLEKILKELSENTNASPEQILKNNAAILQIMRDYAKKTKKITS
jgi:transcriptional regulator with XRE-family HTH domain